MGFVEFLTAAAVAPLFVLSIIAAMNRRLPGVLIYLIMEIATLFCAFILWRMSDPVGWLSPAMTQGMLVGIVAGAVILFLEYSRPHPVTDAQAP
jgi:hypothetical protein